MSKQLKLQKLAVEIVNKMAETDENSAEYMDMEKALAAIRMTRIVEYNITHDDSYAYTNSDGAFVIARDKTKPYSNS